VGSTSKKSGELLPILVGKEKKKGEAQENLVGS